MKRISNLAFLVFLFSSQISAIAQRGEAQFPAVKNFGGIYEVPFATVNPESDMEYKIAIEVKMGSSNPDQLNPALSNIARLMNLHVLGGAKKENMHVVAIVHGLATTSVITDEAYKRKFNMSNPNTELIKELRAAGVEIIICGQSMFARDVNKDELAEGVQVSISMLTAFTTYQLKGYAALQF